MLYQYRLINRLELERLAILRDDPEGLTSGRVRAFDRKILQLRDELPQLKSGDQVA